MKVLVTGGAGFIGSSLVKLLEEKGAKVSVLDDFSHANFRNLSNFKGRIIWADICEESIFKKLPKFQRVINEAAVTDTTLKDDAKMMRVNFKGFLNVLSWCVKKNIPLIHASSAGIYGDSPLPMKENQPPQPLNIYGYSKYLCEQEILRISKKVKQPSIVALRYFNVYGPGEEHKLKTKSASMIYQLYLQIRDNRPPRIFKYGEQKRDFIYIKDVVEITMKALEIRKSIIINVGTGKARSFNEIIAILNKLLKKKLKPDYFDNPYRGVYQDYTQADTTLLEKTLKSPARYSLEEGIEDYLRAIKVIS